MLNKLSDKKSENLAAAWWDSLGVKDAINNLEVRTRRAEPKKLEPLCKMHRNVKFTVQWGSPCWELWICALFNKIVNKIFSEDFAQQLSIIVQILHISIILHKIEEMGMTIILKLLFLYSLLASNVQIFVCVFLFFHLSLFLPLLSVLVFVLSLFCLFFLSLSPFCKRLLSHWSTAGLH